MKFLFGALLALWAGSASAQLTDHSATITTTAADILAAGPSNGRQMIWLYNHGSVTVYCRFGATAVAAAKETFGIIGPGGNMKLNKPTDIVPNEKLSCITASSTASLMAVTIP